MIITIIIIIHPPWDFDREDNNPVFLHDTLTHDDAPPPTLATKGWAVLQIRNLDKEQLAFWTAAVCDLELEHSNPVFPLGT